MRSILLASFILLSSPAAAQWFYEGEESAFGDSGVHLAVTGNSSYAFGLRCTPDELVALLITPEDITDSNAASLQLAKPEMLLRVDDHPPLTLPATVDSANGKLRVTAEVGVAVAGEIAKAKRRVSAAAAILGQRYHEQRFGVSGSSRTVSSLLRGCGLPPVE